MSRQKNRVSRRAKRRHTKAIQNVVSGLSREVLVYRQPIKQECPNCYYDKFTDRSTGKCKWTAVTAVTEQTAWEAAGNTTVRYKYFLKGRCPVCRGKGYLEVQRKRWVEALITWDPGARGFQNKVTFTPAGSEGSTVVVLKSNPKHYDLFKNSNKLVIDGIECKMSKPPVLRGLGSEAVLIITAFTTEKLEIDSTEFIKDYK